MFSWYKNTKLMIKLVGAFLGLALGVGSLVGLTSYFSVEDINKVIDDLADRRIPTVKQAAAVERSTLHSLLETKNYLLSLHDATLDRAAASNAVTDHLDQPPPTPTPVPSPAHSRAHQDTEETTAAAHESLSEYQGLYDDILAAAVATEQARTDMVELADSLVDEIIAFFDRVVAGAGSNPKETLTVIGDVWQTMTSMRVSALQYVNSRNPADLAAVEDSIASLNKLYDRLEEGTTSTADLQQVARVRSITEDYQRTVRQLAAGYVELSTLLASLDRAAEDAQLRVREVQDTGWVQMDEGQKMTDDLAHRSMNTTIVVVNIAILLAIIAGVFFARSLVQALGACVQFARRVAQGDLTARLKVNGSDELGVLAATLNEMAGSLADMSGQMSAGAQSMSAASTEILASVSQHTASANEQMAAVNQTGATVNEVRATAEQSAQRAEDVAALAQMSVHVGQDGSAAVAAILKGMSEIKARVETIAQDILALSEQTQQIGEITATVNDLADQSNILALNAAIEAAKAGEQGKGFGVVATEVRNLADQSKQATAKVRVILGDIQKATNAAVLATEQGTRGVEGGMTLAQRAGEVIGQLADNIRNASQAAQQIVASAHQQSAAMDQIAQAMKEINQATMQSVAGARQSQAAAEGLTSLARQLQSMTSRFQINAG